MILARMAKNRVAANLLMLVLLLGGLLTIPRIGKEVFPTAELDVVSVRVPYPGASPEEVEQGVIRAIEEEVRGIEGVKEVRSIADEGLGIVNVELLLGANRDQLLNDVESAVGRITSFPEDVERPTVSLASNRRQVISLVYYGDVPENTLRLLAERARDELLDEDAITLVELSGTRPREISIEIPRDELRRYGLSITEAADRVRAASIDMPAGEIETRSGDVSLRTTEREETASGFEDVLLVARPDGALVRVRDVARVQDGFRDVDKATTFDGKPAIRVDVFRIGDQTPLDVAAAVKRFRERERERLPDTVGVALWNDTSAIYEARMSLLMKNAYLGLAIVLLLLGLFLEPRLAFWVTLGIPVSFLGALLFLPAVDVTINLISLFAFIVTLGLVVDDAIIVGEAIYIRRKEGKDRMDAAIEGVREVARPVLFSIATTCIAFTPMLFVPGVAGQFFRNIPLVVILVLLGSLAESLLVLPAHLGHPMPRLLDLLLRPYVWLMSKLRSDKVSDGLERLVERAYVPVARRAVTWRYTTVAVAVVPLLAVVGLQAGGRIGFSFLPRIEDDQVRATLEMPVGTPFEQTREAAREIVAAAQRVIDESGEEGILEGVCAEIGSIQPEPNTAQVARTGSHLAMVTVDLVPANRRELRSSELSERWRRAVQAVRAKSIRFGYSVGVTAGAPVNLELRHDDVDRLEAAAEEVAAALRRYRGVRDVDPGFERGLARIDFRLTPAGRAQGLTDAAFARELRGSFFGAEAQRFQRGRDEVRVYVRLPEDERRSLDDLEELVLRTPRGGEIPIRRAAELTWDRAYTKIQRTAMKQSVNVTADVGEGVTANEVTRALERDELARIEARYPGLAHAPGGQQEQLSESLTSLAQGFALALIVMFALLSLAFRSYVQPLIVLTAIPFGAVGAVAGHLLLGYGLSLSSMFGLIALSGVVVNDSLLMVVAIDEARERGEELEQAAVSGGARRFRPVLMTSLTTFGGLAPMIFETSTQAKFLVPMAIALGFGIFFATLILVLLVPALYIVVEDAEPAE